MGFKSQLCDNLHCIGQISENIAALFQLEDSVLSACISTAYTKKYFSNKFVIKALEMFSKVGMSTVFF